MARQGREQQADKYFVPENELTDAPGNTRGKPASLRKAGYDLVIAPKERVESAYDRPKEMDLMQCKTDSYVWNHDKEHHKDYSCKFVYCSTFTTSCWSDAKTPEAAVSKPGKSSLQAPLASDAMTMHSDGCKESVCSVYVAVLVSSGIRWHDGEFQADSHGFREVRQR